MLPRRAIVLLMVMSVAVGCSRGPRTYPVSGSVTWNGAPVDEGTINFIAEDLSVAPDSAKIVNGRYDARVKAGIKKVEIFGTRDKRFNEAMGQMERESYIPSRYNAETTLVREVAPRENSLDFALTEKE